MTKDDETFGFTRDQRWGRHERGKRNPRNRKNEKIIGVIVCFQFDGFVVSSVFLSFFKGVGRGVPRVASWLRDRDVTFAFKWNLSRVSSPVCILNDVRTVCGRKITLSV